jgi:diadenosine tetraphosphate (Ap4A) HIT family hydrolase
MPTVFTKIIAGEMPARFVWKDAVSVAFLSIAPLRPGHTLVVPRKEIDHWLDLDDRTMAHLTQVAKSIGRAQMHAFKPEKVGLVIAGLEVRHVHLHVVPIQKVSDLDFAKQDPDVTAVDLDRAAERIRESLRAMGFGEVAS